MKDVDFNNEFSYLDKETLREIADQIIEGYTEGKLQNGKFNVVWDLRVNVWEDE